jgi:23S rRNA (guanosine2251-2'-O)-methyltransferase
MHKIFGIHAIRHALANNKRAPQKLYLTKAAYNQLRKQLEHWQDRLPINIARETYLLTNELYVPSNLNDICSNYNRIILLDCLEDPHNIGAIIRTAAVFGYAVIIRNRGCTINETVVKCASGGIDITDVIVINQLSNVVKVLKKQGFWICGLLDKIQTNSITLTNLAEYQRFVIVIGSEGNGMHMLTHQLCDFTCTLKGPTEFNVLNASVTAGICMFELNRALADQLN